MYLLTQALRREIPPLYSQAHLLDPFCRVKFVMPDDAVVLWVVEGSTWAKDGSCRHQLLIDYDVNAHDVRIRCDGVVGSAWGRESFVTCRHRPLVEYDPARDEVLFFGLVWGLEAELGYFTLADLTALRDPLGGRLKRDESFTPARLSEVKANIPGLTEWEEL